MLVLKVMGPILVVAVLLAEVALDHGWRDKRTRKYRRLRIGFVIGAVVFCFTSVAAVIHDDLTETAFRADVRESQEVNQVERAAAERQATAERRSLAESNEALLSEITVLQDRLEPFEALARSSYPDLELATALTRLREDLSKVVARTADIEERVAPRALSDEQRVRLQSAMSHFRGQAVAVSAASGDADSERFGVELASALRSAGMAVRSERVVFSRRQSGLNVKVGKGEHSPAAGPLLAELRRLDAECSLLVDERFDEGYLAAIIGPKR